MNKLIKALNDPTRRRILEILRKGDLTAGEIADEFEMSKPSISHHLDLLKQAGLVLAEKQGQFVHYSLNTSVLDDLMHWILSLQKTNPNESSQ
ncbi:MAG: ArsR family transcriptional regulator [Bacteroidetes bacterium]|nr:MAG: ArsR family transcriptional regulator [Bacteroidota bacterium]